MCVVLSDGKSSTSLVRLVALKFVMIVVSDVVTEVRDREIYIRQTSWVTGRLLMGDLHGTSCDTVLTGTTQRADWRPDIGALAPLGAATLARLAGRGFDAVPRTLPCL